MAFKEIAANSAAQQTSAIGAGTQAVTQAAMMTIGAGLGAAGVGGKLLTGGMKGIKGALFGAARMGGINSIPLQLMLSGTNNAIAQKETVDSLMPAPETDALQPKESITEQTRLSPPGAFIGQSKILDQYGSPIKREEDND